MDATVENGHLILSAPGVCLGGLCSEVVYVQEGQRQQWRPTLHACRNTVTSPERALMLSVAVEKADETVIVRSNLRNESNTPVFLESMALVSDGACTVGENAAYWSVFRQGYQSWTGTRIFRPEETDLDPYPHPMAITLIDVHNPSPARRGAFRSDLFAAIRNLESRDTVVLGLLSGKDAFGGVEIQIDGHRCARLAIVVDYDGIELPARTEIVVPPMWIAAGDSEHDLIADYADAVGKEMQARIPAQNPVGWCSWYYYFARITEENIVENLKALSDLHDRFPCDYVQVDDGYQSDVGDWLVSNDKFPHGMAWLAEQIRNAGFDAGIWTAPFIARRSSRLLREHPDWFVRNDRGRPRFAIWNPVWGLRGTCYALDTTHPEVLDWLRTTFRTIVHDWGYRVLKLDFLYAAALPGQRTDPSATRAQALRRGLDAIREGAGSDAFLLGCGCPQGPAIGVVDAMRIGPDVTPWWSNWMARGPQRDLHGLATKHAVRNILTRAFSHRRWWLNDPDCLMVRDTNTRLSEDEVRSLATAIAVTDRMPVLSDRVEHLTAKRLELLDRTMRLAGGRARVVDLMRTDMPEVIVSRSADRTAVAVFNFTDNTRTRSIDLGLLAVEPPADGKVVEWWTGAEFPVTSGRIDLAAIPPHGCRVFLV